MLFNSHRVECLGEPKIQVAPKSMPPVCFEKDSQLRQPLLYAELSSAQISELVKMAKHVVSVSFLKVLKEDVGGDELDVSGLHVVGLSLFSLEVPNYLLILIFQVPHPPMHLPLLIHHHLQALSQASDGIVVLKQLVSYPHH